MCAILSELSGVIASPLAVEDVLRMLIDQALMLGGICRHRVRSFIAYCKTVTMLSETDFCMLR